MQHGRDHDERQQHARHTRKSNSPDDPEVPDELPRDRTGLRPRDGLVGAHRERGSSAALDEEPVASGSDVAPTRRAAAREAARHRLERALGRVVGAARGRRNVPPAGVSREALDAAAAQADRSVAEPSAERGGR